MKFSAFGQRASRGSGIENLMNDLGKALSGSGPAPLMLGGGNPAHIPEMEAAWNQRLHEILADPATLPGIVVDETAATLVGAWHYSTHTPPYVGLGYLHDQSQDKGAKSATAHADADLEFLSLEIRGASARALQMLVLDKGVSLEPRGLIGGRRLQNHHHRRSIAGR